MCVFICVVCGFFFFFFLVANDWRVDTHVYVLLSLNRYISLHTFIYSFLFNYSLNYSITYIRRFLPLFLLSRSVTSDTCLYIHAKIYIYMCIYIFYLHFGYTLGYIRFTSTGERISALMRSQSFGLLALRIYFTFSPTHFPMHLSGFLFFRNRFPIVVRHCGVVVFAFCFCLRSLFFFNFFCFILDPIRFLACRLYCARGDSFRMRPRRGKCRPWRPPSAHPGPRTLGPL